MSEDCEETRSSVQLNVVLAVGFHSSQASVAGRRVVVEES